MYNGAQKVACSLIIHVEAGLKQIQRFVNSAYFNFVSSRKLTVIVETVTQQHKRHTSVSIRSIAPDSERHTRPDRSRYLNSSTAVSDRQDQTFHL